MSNTITFDAPQEITLIQKETVSNVNEVNPRQFCVHLMDNGDVCLHAYIDGSRVPLKGCGASDQAALNTALASTVSTLKSQLKTSIESGDYNG
jgi:hypothetical protein